MSKPPRSILGIVFLTVFLDIVGFSVIFPLFPAMLDHYLALEGPDSLIGRLVEWLQGFAGDDRNAVATLFGGILGSLYGLLQFVFATVWGGLSDRIGRRPTLLVTLVGTVLGYALWVVAGGFLVLIAARVIGGIAAGNISTASAAVADTTEGKDRAKGMGIVGMAIGLGFILGPAIGGLASTIDISDPNDVPGMFEVNPFSVPAVIAMALGMLNLAWVALRFPETLPREKRGADPSGRSLDPFRRLKTIDLPGVARTNVIYLLYLTAFAGMEFTLTFLAVERLEFTAVEIAWMFVFVGFLIALVQGGIVRRVAPRYGERRVAQVGLVLNAPGFVLLALARDVGTLYVGLAFMAVGSALIMPCLSALVSRYCPSDRQGLALGAFRSMGSLSRAVGPVLGALLYWRFGSAAPYWAGTAFLAVPFLLALALPPVPEEADVPAQG